MGGRLAMRPAARLEKVCWDALVLGRLPRAQPRRAKARRAGTTTVAAPLRPKRHMCLISELLCQQARAAYHKHMRRSIPTTWTCQSIRLMISAGLLPGIDRTFHTAFAACACLAIVARRMLHLVPRSTLSITPGWGTH